MVGLKVDGAWLGLSLDTDMLGLSVGKLKVGWLVGAVLELSLGLLVGLPGLPLRGLLLEPSLGLRLASWNVLSSEKEAPAIAEEGHIAQYGPTLTGIGSEVLVQAVPKKVDLTNRFVGSLMRHGQRSWLKDDAR
jgi:hypothetical protein